MNRKKRAMTPTVKKLTGEKWWEEVSVDPILLKMPGGIVNGCQGIRSGLVR